MIRYRPIKGNRIIKRMKSAGYTMPVDMLSITKDGGGAVNEVIVQSIIDDYDVLGDSKEAKVEDLKTEGLARIRVVYPAIKDWDDLDLVRGQWLSIKPAARQADADFQSMIDIFVNGKAAVTVINALETVAEVQAYDVVNTPVWPQ